MSDVATRGSTPHLEDRADLVDRFGERAEPLGVAVQRLEDSRAAASAVAAIVRDAGLARSLISAELRDRAPVFGTEVASQGISLAPAEAPSETRDAPLGLSLARRAVAETGSVLLAERSLSDRGIGLLVVSHIVICPTSALVASLDDTASVLREMAMEPGGGYATLVTGPSRTADIERVLTVGVQGPARVIVLFVDDLT